MQTEDPETSLRTGKGAMPLSAVMGVGEPLASRISGHIPHPESHLFPRLKTGRGTGPPTSSWSHHCRGGGVTVKGPAGFASGKQGWFQIWKVPGSTHGCSLCVEHRQGTPEQPVAASPPQLTLRLMPVLGTLSGNSGDPCS